MLGIPTRARVYIIVLALLASIQSGLFAWSVLHDHYRGAIPIDQVPVALFVFSVLALAAAIKPITMPAGDQKTVVSAVLVASILLVGPEYSIVPAIVMVIGTHYVAQKPFVRLVFNLSQYVLTVGISGVLYHLLRTGFGLGSAPGLGLAALSFNSIGSLAALAIFLVVYFILNTFLVAIVMALTQETPVSTAYRQSTELVVAHFLTTVVIGVIAAVLWATSEWTAALVGVMIYFIYKSYSISASLEVARKDLLDRMSELQRRTAELELLGQVNTRLTRAVDLPSLWEMLAEQVGRIIDTSCFFVALRDDAHDRVLLAFGQDEGVVVTDEVLPPGPGLTRWIIDQSRPLLIEEYREVSDSLPSPIVWGNGRAPESLLAVPMILDGKVLGAICAQAYRPKAYTEDDLRLLSSIAGQAAVAIRNAQLQKEAAETRAIRQLDLLKTQFISTVSHELRSPLTPIVGYSEILTMDDYGSDEVHQMAGEINRAAVHMQLLVDDLLDLSRIEAGRMRLHPQDLHLDDLLRDAARDHEGISTRHQIQLTLPELLPTVRSDKVRVRQVVDNLLSNAIKYSPDGGTVEIAVTAHDGEVRVAISDEGPGIPVEKQSRLFEAFYRVEGELTSRVRGTGLGLAICRHLVELHGGRIWVESQVGRGSTFTFSLPVVAPESSNESSVDPVFAVGETR